MRYYKLWVSFYDDDGDNDDDNDDDVYMCNFNYCLFPSQVENIKNLQEANERHTRNLLLLQKEHAEVIDNIAKSKQLERQAIENMSNKKSDIDSMLNNSQVVVEGLESLQKKLQDRDETLGESKENHLRLQERNLECTFN